MTLLLSHFRHAPRAEQSEFAWTCRSPFLKEEGGGGTPQKSTISFNWIRTWETYALGTNSLNPASNGMIDDAVMS